MMKFLDLLLYVMYKAQYPGYLEDVNIFGAKLLLSFPLSGFYCLVVNEFLILVGVPALILKEHAYISIIVNVLFVAIIFGIYRKRPLSLDESRAIMQRYKLDMRLICFVFAFLLIACPVCLLAIHFEHLGVYNIR